MDHHQAQIPLGDDVLQTHDMQKHGGQDVFGDLLETLSNPGRLFRSQAEGSVKAFEKFGRPDNLFHARGVLAGQRHYFRAGLPRVDKIAELFQVVFLEEFPVVTIQANDIVIILRRQKLDDRHIGYPLGEKDRRFHLNFPSSLIPWSTD